MYGFVGAREHTEWSHAKHRGQRQVILRLQGEQQFRIAIVPWSKGRRPESLEVQEQEEGLVVKVDNATLTVGPDGARR